MGLQRRRCLRNRLPTRPYWTPEFLGGREWAFVGNCQAVVGQKAGKALLMEGVQGPKWKFQHTANSDEGMKILCRHSPLASDAVRCLLEPSSASCLMRRAVRNPRTRNPRKIGR